MKIKYLIVCFFAAAMFCACGEDDNNTSSVLRVEDNPFIVPADATDPVSVLRREFYNDTGIHLLFSDTLRNDFYGYDKHGKEIRFIQLLDPGYKMTAHSNLYYSFELVNDLREKQLAVDLLRENVVSQIDPSMYPFSIYVASRIDSFIKDGDGDSYSAVDTDIQEYSGLRGVIISLRDISSMTATRFDRRVKEVKGFILGQGAAKLEASIFHDFAAFSEEYYGRFDFTGRDGREIGMLGNNVSYGYPQWYSREEDIASWVQAVVVYGESEFEAEFGPFPICLEKYLVMRRIMLDLGYTL